MPKHTAAGTSHKKSVAMGTKAGREATKTKIDKLTGKKRRLTRREQIDQALEAAGA